MLGKLKSNDRQQNETKHIFAVLDLCVVQQLQLNASGRNSQSTCWAKTSNGALLRVGTLNLKMQNSKRRGCKTSALLSLPRVRRATIGMQNAMRNREKCTPIAEQP